MTDDTQPEAMNLADWLEAVGGGPSAKRCAALLREQHARIAELEAQLEAIGAGGVSGPLMGRAALSANAGEPWTGGEEWEALAWHLCAEENGEDACGELLWEGGPIPEPWGDRWMKYESDAKRMIELVRKFVAAPPTAQAEGWRPIETAPKEGVFLVYMQDEARPARRMQVANWHPNVKVVGGLFSFDCATVTHWMPLPLPPTSAEGVEHG